MAGNWSRWLGYLTPRHLRLYWRLLGDPRVPALPKLAVTFALAYLIWPLDLITDLLPVLGLADDLALLVLSLVYLVKSAPPEVVDQHLNRG